MSDKNIGDKVAGKADKVSQRLVNLYLEAEEEIRRQLVEAISRGLNLGNRLQVLDSIRQIVNELTGSTRNWVEITVPEFYKNGVKEYQDLYKGITPLEGIGGVDFGLINTRVVETLMGNAFLEFGEAIQGVMRSSTAFINTATRVQLRDTIVKGEIKGSSIRNISKEMEKIFLDKGITAFVDKGGRRWSLSRYGQMLSRTTLMNAHIEGVITEGARHGVYFFEISSHPHLSDVCSPFEGRIFDIRTASQDDLPLYHPNCLHVLIPRPDLQSIPK